MKHLKTYESLGEPQVGDYVICKIESGIMNPSKSLLLYLNFINNNIGRIREKTDDYYIVMYNNVPISIKNRFNRIQSLECLRKNVNFETTRELKIRKDSSYYIDIFAKTRKELKIKIEMKKYNL